ncbi:Bgt-20107 [Blumeria graminis f. sp. tritici]|uniref:Bgt-20107 n=2 Tax=Blumeria graminis f. sp. tritici TaxID=62690 RepID=A0A9X9MGQ8_BLUGR|nr:Bgt-20107 [Blumeria graminis f. sp. tritici]
MVSIRPWLSAMQDNTSAHTAARTMEEMRQRLIQPIFSPTNSPDLNPIESVWNRIKDYIQHHLPNLAGGK